jgi:hypothetical protein
MLLLHFIVIIVLTVAFTIAFVFAVTFAVTFDTCSAAATVTSRCALEAVGVCMRVEFCLQSIAVTATTPSTSRGPWCVAHRVLREVHIDMPEDPLLVVWRDAQAHQDVAGQVPQLGDALIARRGEIDAVTNVGHTEPRKPRGNLVLTRRILTRSLASRGRSGHLS